MTSKTSFNSKLIWGPLAILGLVVLLLYLQGAFANKVPPGRTEVAFPKASGQTAMVEEKTLPVVLNWPATVASHTIVELSPKIAGRIQAIKVDIGAKVNQGDLLVQLDDAQIRAQLAAARAALVAAEAQAQRAAADAARFRNLFAQGAATQRDLDAALATERSTRAQAAEAHHQIEAVQAQLKETRLRALFAGNVIERRADPGDMGLPGHTILVIQDPARLRVETHIPEHCARLLAVGDRLAISLPGQGVELDGLVTDIAGAADPLTHTLLVKAALPEDSQVMPGAFVWARQNCGSRRTLLAPAASIRRIGQLEEVDRVIDGKRHVRLVRTGRPIDGKVEILSGLKAGDVVELSTPTRPSPASGGGQGRGIHEGAD